MAISPKVGQIYVGLTVDGSDIDKQIVDSVSKGNYEDLGEESGGEFSRGFQNRVEDVELEFKGTGPGAKKAGDSAGKNFVTRMSRAIKANKELEGRISGMLKDAVDSGELEGMFQDLGRRAGHDFGTGLDNEFAEIVARSLHRSLLKAAQSGQGVDLLGAVLKSSKQGEVDLDFLGPAYQRLVADLKRELGKARAEMDAAAADAEIRGNDLSKKLQQGIVGALDKSEGTDKKIKAKLTQLIKSGSLTKLYERVGEELGESFVEGLDNELEASVTETIHKSVRKALRDAHAKGGKADLDVLFDIDVGAVADRARSAASAIYKERERLFKLEEKIRLAEEKASSRAREKARVAEEKARAAEEKARARRGLFYRDDDTERTSGRTFGRSLGRMFGLGSRNNILNLFGRTVGNMAGIMKTTTNAASSMFKTFLDGAQSAGEAAGAMQKMGAGFAAVGARLGTMVGGLVASGPAILIALAVAAAALTAVLVTLSTVISALIAVLSALVGTILSALVGALAVGGGAILALVAAAGLLVAAFTSITEAQRKVLAGSFAPLKEQLTGIGQDIFKEFVEPMRIGTTEAEKSRSAIQIWAENLSTAIHQLAPLAPVMGRAFAEAGNTLTKSLSGNGIKLLMDSLVKHLPSITKSMSSALGGFMNGLTAMFAAIMPQVRQFAGYLDRTAQSFATWASSAKGQNSIKDFVDRAVESLKSFWGLLKGVGGLIKDVFFSKEAQDSGNQMFKGMTNSIKDLRDFIKKAKKDGSFKKWMDEAKDFADAVGDATKEVTLLLAAMASSKTLKTWTAVLDGAVWVSKQFRKALEAAKKFGISPFKIAISALAGPFAPLIAVISSTISMIGKLGDAWSRLKSSISGGLGTPKLPSVGGGGGGGQSWGPSTKPSKLKIGASSSAIKGGSVALRLAPKSPDDYQAQGKAALKETYESHGGYLKDPKGSGSGGGGGKKGKKAKKYRNPYLKEAASIIAGLPVVESDVRNALREYGKDTKALLDGVAKETSGEGAASSIQSSIATMRDSAGDLIRNKQEDLRSAALSLQSAGSKAAAKKALQEVRSAQASLAAAQDHQRRLNLATAMLAAHQTITLASVDALVAGASAQNSTLAEIAAARGVIADKINDATTKLTSAQDTMKSYGESLVESTKSFATIIGVQARMIDGVQAALTSSDINQSVRDRLEKAKNFQLELRQLASMGLSDDAYKQIVDAGVEQGGETARALIAGGLGAIQELNDLMAQLDTVGKGIGSDASTRLYQAGVDAAQGLLDGLKSQETALAAAAKKIADSLVAAVNQTLGIASPSRVMMESMKNVGDGIVMGLASQAGRVSRAAGSLSGMIAVSPEVAAHAARMNESPVVSRNDPPKEFNLTVVTPTEDPYAVVMETMNELTGRL